MWWGCILSVVCLCMKWWWCDDVVDWVSLFVLLLIECHVFVCVWSEDDVLMLLSECRVFMCMKCGWCDDVVKWVSCVSVWSKDVVMMLLHECHVIVYKVMMMWWCYCVSVVCLCMKWGWCDDVLERVSCVCVWSEDDVMRVLSEWHVFVYKVVEWVSCVCV